MEEIPGKNNYGAWLPAQSFDADILNANPDKAGQPMNGANYHRSYKLSAKDAMGQDTSERGFSDRLYVAMTDQDSITGPSYKAKDGNVIRAKVSYAIPMEIIYLTPLAKWNPYDLAYEEGGKVTGLGSKSSPYSRMNRKTFFQTPSSFFTGTGETDAADTSRTAGVYIKQKDGTVVKTQASGVRIKFPSIAGINGIIRQRYPIMPIYGEGNTFWKRLNAFEDSLQDYQTHVDSSSYYYIIGHSHSNVVTDHTHSFRINVNQFKSLRDGKTTSLMVTTTKAIGHTHDLKIYVNNNNELVVEMCDGKVAHSDSSVCFDHHPAKLTRDA